MLLNYYHGELDSEKEHVMLSNPTTCGKPSAGMSSQVAPS